MSPQQGLSIAREKGLDLVEVSPTAQPPVCRITDYGRYQYQEQKRTRQAKKHQKTIEIKEIKFRPKVDEHDYNFKKKHVERFLANGDKVKATIFFRGREMAHPEFGRHILDRLVEELGEVATQETMPRMEGQSDAHDLVEQDRGEEGTLGDAQDQDSSWRGEAVQQDRHWKDHPRQSVQATYPHEQDDEAAERPAWHHGRLRRGPAAAREDDSV